MLYAANPSQTHLVGGDFNAVMDQEEDRKVPDSRGPRKHKGTGTDQCPGTTLLLDMTTALGLHDLWRLHHPIDKECTTFSHAHNSPSRIDYFLGTEPSNTQNKICPNKRNSGV